MPDLFAYLPEAVSAGVFWGFLAASLAGSFITSAFGIGGGALLLAIMATLLPTAVLIPVHGLVQVGSNAGRLFLLFRWVHWPAVPAFAAGSVIGCVVGGLVFVELPVSAIQIGIGCFVIWSVLNRPPKWVRRFPLITGVLSSFLTMFLGATGLFVSNYTKSFLLARHGHVGTQAALMSVQHSLKVIVFGLLGFGFASWWLMVLLMTIAGVVGTWLGRKVLGRMDDRGFLLILNTLLVLTSLRLIWGGLTALVANQ